MMKTHTLYRQKGKIRQYFSGVYEGEIDSEGFAIIDFKWSTDRKDATYMQVTLAWDLLSMCRYQWPELNLQLERIPEWKQVFTNGLSVAR